MNFRVEKELRDAFLKACNSNDETGAQVLRKFMREYVEKNAQGKLI